MKVNRRSFLAGLFACTARCSFGLSLPRVPDGLYASCRVNVAVYASFGKRTFVSENFTLKQSYYLQEGDVMHESIDPRHLLESITVEPLELR